jgi:hypothetical protein
MRMFDYGDTPTDSTLVRRAYDQGAGAGGLIGVPGGTASGLVAGTKVATTFGWRPVEAVVPGDKVLTFDAGMHTVTQISRCALWRRAEPCPKSLWPLAVPAEALGNAQPMVLLPEQAVIIESDVGEELYGDPFTLIPAAALDGFRGIHRIEPAPGLEVVTLHFTRDQVIFGSAGALFFCPSARSLTLSDPQGDAANEYVILGYEDACFLIGCISIDDGEADYVSEPGFGQAAVAA